VKKCHQCGDLKSESEFYSDRSQKDGKRTICKPCADQNSLRWRSKNSVRYKLTKANANLRRLYGVSLNQKLQLVEEQEGCCAICGEMMTLPHLDHNHKTGTVRAALCSGCNSGIGNFKESPDRLRAAIQYLEKHSEDWVQFETASSG